MVDSTRSIIFFFLFLLISLPLSLQAQDSEVSIARLKYRGGGDWYNDPSSLTNLIRFVNQTFTINLNKRYDDVESGSDKLFNYPFAFMTGHGNVEFNSYELENLRNWLQNGGFLFVDDDYGLDKYVRGYLNELIPGQSLVEIPYDHPIYLKPYAFPKGPPKIHEHDGKPPQGFGLFYRGRLVVYYTYESNPGDGWADPEIHNTPEALRQKALQLGANVLIHTLVN